MLIPALTFLVATALVIAPKYGAGLEENGRHVTDVDNDDAKSDAGFWSDLLGNLKSGNGRRWASINFAYQIACYQGRGGSLFSKAWWAYKTYNKYGCYCGGGDYLGNYLDATDYCCKLHDSCYSGVGKKYNVKLGCHTYTTPYSVSCCKDQKITKCTDSGPSAGREYCECDQAMAACVASHKALSTYDKKYMDNRTECESKSGKPLSPIEILRSCKHFFSDRVTLKTTYGSQGNCPAEVNGSKKKSWWFGKKKDE